MEAGPTPSYEGVPSISMESSRSGNVLRVVMRITNDTQNTYVVPNRRVVLDVFRNGTRVQQPTAEGSDFVMVPGARVTGTFEVLLDTDATYDWQGKVWYYGG
jgi:hypothetical protein